MKLLKGKVAVVTGAGRGLGRAHALMLARHGAKVVVNDLGSKTDGSGSDLSPAEEVVATIRAGGGEAIVDAADVSDWVASKAMIDSAVSAFGRLDILINNAGILRDGLMLNMSEADWDLVIKVHLKGSFAPMHHAGNYWRAQAKAGHKPEARIVNTSSHSGLYGNIGQVNYVAAKAGIAALTVTAARELQRYGVTVNALAPRAITRMTEDLKQWTPEEVAMRDPDYIAALAVWLCSDEAKGISGRVFEASGYGYAVAENWSHGPAAEASTDPTGLGASLYRIHAEARKNAGFERDTWLDP